MAAYARQAKTATSRPTRSRSDAGYARLDQLRVAQKETVGSNRAGAREKRGIRNPGFAHPALAGHRQESGEASTDPRFSLGRQVRAGGDRRREATTRAFRNVVNAVAIEQERETYRARVETGATVADLEALAASGRNSASSAQTRHGSLRSTLARASSVRRAPLRHVAARRMKALPVGALAADDCALLLWGVWPNLDVALEVVGRGDSNIRRRILRVKTKRAPNRSLSMAPACIGGSAITPAPILSPACSRPAVLRGGYRPTFIRSSSRPWARTARSQTKPTAGFIASIPARTSRCSRASAVLAGPPGATSSTSSNPNADEEKSLDEGYRVIRERVAAGGPTWVPK